MKNQVLFSSKDKSKKLKCRLLQISFDALWVKYPFQGSQKEVYGLMLLCDPETCIFSICISYPIPNTFLRHFSIFNFRF